MKLARTHSFAMPAAPWLSIWDHEWQALWGLPAWATRLFIVLVALSDFQTGLIRTSYGELLNALKPDRQERGGRPVHVPSLDQVRRMLRRFAALNILARDKRFNEARGCLFFHVCGRKRLSASNGNIARGIARGATGRRASNGAGSERSSNEVSRGVSPGLSPNKYKPPYPPSERTLSTGTKPPEHIAAALKVARIKLSKGDWQLP